MHSRPWRAQLAPGRGTARDLTDLGAISTHDCFNASVAPFRRPARRSGHPGGQRAEFELAIAEILAGQRSRLETLEYDLERIKTRALKGLEFIERSIAANPTAGQSRYLVRFLAGLYNGEDYPFDLTVLRGLDDALCNACLDYLNYDRLGRLEVHRHLRGGEAQLHRWLADAGIKPATPST